MPISVSLGSSTAGPLEAIVHPASGNDIVHLSIRSKDWVDEINIFRDGPTALNQFLDLGYAIVAAVNKIKDAECPTCNGFGVEHCATHAPADAEPAFVPFAINDAVEHDIEAEEARATIDTFERQVADIDAEPVFDASKIGIDPALVERL